MMLLDIRTCDLTLGEVLARVDAWAKAMPDKEIYMDGDSYAIVAVPRRCRA